MVKHLVSQPLGKFRKRNVVLRLILGKYIVGWILGKYTVGWMCIGTISEFIMWQYFGTAMLNVRVLLPHT
jgi:hypothetical protein